MMRGSVTAAVLVPGEHPGEVVLRRWMFSGRDCTPSFCRVLRLRRQRSDHRYNTIVLRRDGVGRYRGHGHFYVGLNCNGVVDRRGELVPYRITVTVLAVQQVQADLVREPAQRGIRTGAGSTGQPAPSGPATMRPATPAGSRSSPPHQWRRSPPP